MSGYLRNLVARTFSEKPGVHSQVGLPYAQTEGDTPVPTTEANPGTVSGLARLESPPPAKATSRNGPSRNTSSPNPNPPADLGIDPHGTISIDKTTLLSNPRIAPNETAAIFPNRERATRIADNKEAPSPGIVRARPEFEPLVPTIPAIQENRPEPTDKTRVAPTPKRSPTPSVIARGSQRRQSTPIQPVPPAVETIRNVREQQIAQDEPTEVHVSIGRIEVTAVMTPPPPKRQPAAAKKGMSLDEYLAKRNKARR